MMGRLDGKVAVVLGAAGKDNMGQVIARRFAAEGARVMVAGRHEAPLRDLAADIGGTYRLCDITQKTDVAALAAAARTEYGTLDVAVNCTGWGLMVRLLDTTEEQIDRLSALRHLWPPRHRFQRWLFQHQSQRLPRPCRTWSFRPPFQRPYPKSLFLPPSLSCRR